MDQTEINTHTIAMIRHVGSYIDPSGVLFDGQKEMFRGINPQFADFYRKVLQSKKVSNLLKTKIVETSIARETFEGFPLILRHRKIVPPSYCFEWPAQMLKDAALLTLDLCIDLIDDKLILQDAYPWNILFEGSKPLFVDFTSIVEEDPHLLWVAYDQFCNFFLYPLLIACTTSGKVMRYLLQDHINGVQFNDLNHIIPKSILLRMPWIVTRIYLPRILIFVFKKLKIDSVVLNISNRLHPSQKARKSFISALYADIKKIPLKRKNSFWSKYYSDIDTFLKPEKFNAKQATVQKILLHCNPKTVVDIGCNQGGYSIMAAKSGASVTSFDSDEDCIAMLYDYSKQNQLPILPLVIDFLCPSPSCGWRSIQYQSSCQRLQGEMAFAFGLVHHLAITQRQTYERIIPALADYCNKWLFTEFIPLSDPRTREILSTNKRSMDWYSVDSFCIALKNHFHTVTTFPSSPEGRVLCLCEK